MLPSRETTPKRFRPLRGTPSDAYKQIEYCEKQIEIPLADGVSVIGRIDLVRRRDTGQTIIVDLKSNDRAQPEALTEAQLHVYALGYKELTGKDADLVEIYELDDRKRKARSVDSDFISDVKVRIAEAAKRYVVQCAAFLC